MKSLKLILTLAFGFILLGAGSAFAQSSSDISALATVNTAVNFDQKEDLDFGTVAIGTTNTIVVADATSGQIRIVGNATVTDLVFSSLDNLTDGSGNSLTTTYGAGDASYVQDTDGGGEPRGSGNSFDPSGGASALSLDLTSGPIFVWIGGAVQAATDQAAGNYSDTITLTVTFN